MPPQPRKRDTLAPRVPSIHFLGILKPDLQPFLRTPSKILLFPDTAPIVLRLNQRNAKSQEHLAVKFRAPAPIVQTDDDLKELPPAAGFKPADGVRCEGDGRTITNCFHESSRRAVVSIDWTHTQHSSPTRTWRVKATTAKREFGDIFVGLTEATANVFNGTSIAFDCRGNFWFGRCPQKLTAKYRKRHFDRVMEDGTQEGDSTLRAKNAIIAVTADLEAQQATIELSSAKASQDAKPAASFVVPISGWKTARLMVSFSSPGDVITMV